MHAKTLLYSIVLFSALLLQNFRVCLGQITNDQKIAHIILRPHLYDSLVKVQQQSPSDSLQVILFVLQGLSETNTDEQRFISSAKARELSSQHNWEWGLALSALPILDTRSDYATIRQVDSVMTNSIDLFQRINLPVLSYVTKYYGSQRLYRFGRHYVRSFQITDEFIDKPELKNEFILLSKAWNLKGEVYRILHNYPQAMNMYRISALYSAAMDSAYPAPFINMGTVYKNLGKYDSAFHQYQSLGRIIKSNKSATAYVKNRMASVFLLQKKFSKAEQLAFEAMSEYYANGNKQGIILTLSNLTVLFHEQGKMAESFKYGEEAVSLAMSIEYYPEELQIACETIARSFEEAGSFQKAAKYYKLYSLVREEIFGPSTNMAMLNEQLKLYENNQQLEKTIFSQKQKEAEEKVKSQQRVIILAIALCLAAIVATLLVLRNNRVINQLNYELQEKQDEILTQSEELKSSYEEVESINANLDALVKERTEKVLVQNQRLRDYSYFNAHQIRGPLARILGLVMVLEKELKEGNLLHYAEMLKRSGEDLDNSIRQINKLISEDDLQDPIK